LWVWAKEEVANQNVWRGGTGNLRMCCRSLSWIVNEKFWVFAFQSAECVQSAWPCTEMWYKCSCRGAQIFQQYRIHLKILGARRVTHRKCYTEHPQILWATIQRLVFRATWRPTFMHHCGSAWALKWHNNPDSRTSRLWRDVWYLP
jgi:hypothetical protein